MEPELQIWIQNRANNNILKLKIFGMTLLLPETETKRHVMVQEERKEKHRSRLVLTLHRPRRMVGAHCGLALDGSDRV